MGAPATAIANHHDESPRRRAPALTRVDRRDRIIDAAVPLLAQHGSSLTSRQIAEASEVSEGTIFRAFGDKESLLREAALRYFSTETLLLHLRSIDGDDSLEGKLEQLLMIMIERFAGAFRVISALNGAPPDDAEDAVATAAAVAELFARDALSCSPDEIVSLVRMLAFASSVPAAAGSGHSLPPEHLARLLLRGIAVSPTGTGTVVAP